jgi:hypothetical protein
MLLEWASVIGRTFFAVIILKEDADFLIHLNDLLAVACLVHDADNLTVSALGIHFTLKDKALRWEWCEGCASVCVVVLLICHASGSFC